MFQNEAITEARAEYPKYFEALQKHPRLLIGTEVPRIGTEGTETLRDSADAAEWQEAVKQQLVAEIKDRAVRLAEAGSADLVTVHGAIDLFQNNVDIVPGTKQFDRELADRFVKLAKPYEARNDGKLYGYTIPVQGLLSQLRTQIASERAAAPAAAAAPVAAAAPAAAAAPVEQPQAGIPSKAGSGTDAEDFSTLFGTLGMPGFRI